MTPLDVIADLNYRSYAYNRTEAPHITPDSWKKVYGPEVDEMEMRYQVEKKNLAAESGIRKDQRERLEGNLEHDFDVFGRRLEAGS